VPQVFRERLIDQIMPHLERYVMALVMILLMQRLLNRLSIVQRRPRHIIIHRMICFKDSSFCSWSSDASNVWLFRRHDKATEWIDSSGHAIGFVSSTKQLNFSSSLSDSSSNSAREEEPVFSSVPAAQAVNLLASQLPIYSGQEEEYINLWIDKI